MARDHFDIDILSQKDVVLQLLSPNFLLAFFRSVAQYEKLVPCDLTISFVRSGIVRDKLSRTCVVVDPCSFMIALCYTAVKGVGYKLN